MTDQLRVNGHLVDDLSGVARHGGSALTDGPALLRRVLEADAWREFVTQRDERVQHRRFSDFVTARPLRGLGADMDVIRRLAGGEPDLLRLLRDAEKVGQGRRTDLGEPSGESPRRRGGNETDYQAARLERDHPEQYAAVQSGELTTNAAAVLAGIRPRRISVRPDDARSLVDSLARANESLLPEVRDEITRRLAGTDDQEPDR